MLTYVIGDVHGRRREFETLLNLIKQDIQANAKNMPTRIVQIGDLIDRGEDSKGVVEIAMQLPNMFPNSEIIVLKGNHEDCLVRIHDGETHITEGWYPHKHRFGGGLRTMESYGANEVDPSEGETIQQQIKDYVTAEHLSFMRNLPLSYEDETYFFAHAGVRPEVSLDQQKDEDLLFIKNDFMPYDGKFPKIIIHGHTPRPSGQVLHNRVNTDTGAAYGLELSCFILEKTYKPNNIRKLTTPIIAESDWVDNVTW